MEKKTIGAFIAALRKANGMTQQELADRLNISNKAVSRWERDECAPDILLIPAIAELFEVSCDELLRGERIVNESRQTKAEAKIEKRLAAVVCRKLSNFKTAVYISLSLAIMGYICMLGISYSFFRPIIAFAVMMLFSLASIVCTVIATSKLKEVKYDNELFEQIDEQTLSKFNKTLGNYSFASLFTSLSVIVMSFPLICFNTEYTNSVLSFNSYLPLFAIPIALALTLLYVWIKKYYIAWITDIPRPKKPKDHKLYLMNAVQLSSVFLAGILFIVSPYFIFEPTDTFLIVDVLNILALLFLCADIICFVVFIVKFKNNSKDTVFYGVRNLFLVPSALFLTEAHHVGFYSAAEIRNIYSTVYERYESWDTRSFVISVVYTIIVILVFEIIKNHYNKNPKYL